jgi:hypothetical protein
MIEVRTLELATSWIAMKATKSADLTRHENTS